MPKAMTGVELDNPEASLRVHPQSANFPGARIDEAPYFKNIGTFFVLERIGLGEMI